MSLLTPTPRFRDSRKHSKREQFRFLVVFLDERIIVHPRRRGRRRKDPKTVLERTFEPKFLPSTEEWETANVTPSRIAKCRGRRRANNEWIMMKSGPKNDQFPLWRRSRTSTTAATATHINHYRIHQIPPRRRETDSTRAHLYSSALASGPTRQDSSFFTRSERNQQIDCERHNMRTRIRVGREWNSIVGGWTWGWLIRWRNKSIWKFHNFLSRDLSRLIRKDFRGGFCRKNNFVVNNFPMTQAIPLSILIRKSRRLFSLLPSSFAEQLNKNDFYIKNDVVAWDLIPIGRRANGKRKRLTEWRGRSEN